MSAPGTIGVGEGMSESVIDGISEGKTTASVGKVAMLVGKVAASVDGTAVLTWAEQLRASKPNTTRSRQRRKAIVFAFSLIGDLDMILSNLCV